MKDPRHPGPPPDGARDGARDGAPGGATAPNAAPGEQGPAPGRRLPHLDRASSSTVARLSSYYRLLGDLEAEGTRTVSSRRLAERGGITSAQVRKDLSVFGHFGRRGLGYNVRDLRRRIQEILGLTRQWRVALFGAGNLGHALFAYEAFRAQGFYIEAVFDADPDKVGRTWNGIRIRPPADLAAVARERPFDIAIVAVPEAAAQDVVDAAVAAGVRGILNFAPGKLHVPDHVALREVDLSIAMESLSYSLVKDLAEEGGRPLAGAQPDGGVDPEAETTCGDVGAPHDAVPPHDEPPPRKPAT